VFGEGQLLEGLVGQRRGMAVGQSPNGRAQRRHRGRDCLHLLTEAWVWSSA
jgi:hypothetical protein